MLGLICLTFEAPKFFGSIYSKWHSIWICWIPRVIKFSILFEQRAYTDVHHTMLDQKFRKLTYNIQ